MATAGTSPQCVIGPSGLQIHEVEITDSVETGDKWKIIPAVIRTAGLVSAVMYYGMALQEGGNQEVPTADGPNVFLGGFIFCYDNITRDSPRFFQQETKKKKITAVVFH